MPDSVLQRPGELSVAHQESLSSGAALDSGEPMYPSASQRGQACRPWLPRFAAIDWLGANASDGRLRQSRLYVGGMTIPRSQLVDYETPGYYHCISRCVRRHALLKHPRRRRWLLDRLSELSRSLAIEVFAFAILENHLHLLIRIRPDLVRSLDDREVALRRVQVLPRRVDPKDPRTSIESQARLIMASPSMMRKARRDLADPGFFHRLLKEPCARLWNKEDGVKGHFWEARYKSPRVLDDAALLRVARYIDLNQIRAREAGSLTASAWTTARLHWLRLRDALVAGIAAAKRTTSEVARAICDVPWEPSHACDARAEAEPGGVPSRQARTLDRPKVSLVKYLWSVDGIGRQPRADKPGVIAARAPCPIRAAIEDALRLSKTVRAQRTGECSSMPCVSTEDLLGFVRRLVYPDSLAEPAGYAVVGETRGTCYGSGPAVAAEARRRGLARVMPIHLRE